MKYQNINQSSQCLWLETFKRTGRDITDLEELHKEDISLGLD